MSNMQIIKEKIQENIDLLVLFLNSVDGEKKSRKDDGDEGYTSFS